MKKIFEYRLDEDEESIVVGSLGLVRIVTACLRPVCLIYNKLMQEIDFCMVSDPLDHMKMEHLTEENRIRPFASLKDKEDSLYA